MHYNLGIRKRSMYEFDINLMNIKNLLFLFKRSYDLKHVIIQPNPIKKGIKLSFCKQVIDLGYFKLLNLLDQVIEV